MRNVNSSEKILKLHTIVLLFILGIIAGLVSKYADTVGISSDSNTVLRLYQDSISIVQQITTDLGIWVFVATIVAVVSRSSKAAAIHVFVFFIGMLLAYYFYSMLLFGFFPTYYFYRWGLIALLSPIGAYLPKVRLISILETFKRR